VNIYVLCTGRCGSMTFIEACKHMTNYTAGHETRSGCLGRDRFAYPPNHIEADNRLAWMLGRLGWEAHLRSAPFFVHLTRDRVATARSFLRRYHEGIIGAYNSHILMGLAPDADPLAVCLDYVDTVEGNIRAFVSGQKHVAEIDIDDPQRAFAQLWLDIHAEGDLAAALSEFKVKHNASPEAAC
jgi:hypothetical protein